MPGLGSGLQMLGTLIFNQHPCKIWSRQLSVNLKLYLSKQVVIYMLPFLRPARPVSGTSYLYGFVSFASYEPLSLLFICSILLIDGLLADDFLCHHLERVFQMTPPLINPTSIPVSIQWLQDLFF